jgi:hypothetical protein
VRQHVFAATLLLASLLAVTPSGEVAAWNRPTQDPAHAVRAIESATPDDDTTRPTINEFLPQERSLGECISALPKPGCGSEARGGWRQTVVLLVVLAGLAFIAWRIVRAARRARVSRTPDPTTVPDGGDAAPAP